jgi:hypothetical protein
MKTQPEISEENLSKAIAAALSISGNITVTQQDCYILVAHCFEKVTPELKKEWETAISVARLLAPWLDSESSGVWCMNLFTIDGLWMFPAD